MESANNLKTNAQQMATELNVANEAVAGLEMKVIHHKSVADAAREQVKVKRASQLKPIFAHVCEMTSRHCFSSFAHHHIFLEHGHAVCRPWKTLVLD
jgi:hypothetical protein